MTDIISTARAAGVHPLAMSEEYLPGLQRFAAVFQQEIERLTLNGIHTCHPECQRPLCKVTRERDALLEKIKAVIAAEQSEGSGRGGFVNTPPTREHQRRVAQAWQELHAAIKAVEGEKT